MTPRPTTATTTTATTCRHVLRSGELNHIAGTYGVLYCSANADESGYCPVHRQDQAPAASTPRPKRDLDTDVLPWIQDDRRVFETHHPKRGR